MDSISKKVEGLKGQFQELSTQGGLGGLIKVVLDVGTVLLKFSNTDIGQAIIKSGILVTSVILLGKTFTAFGKTALVGTVVEMYRYQKALASMAIANGVASSSTAVLSATIKGLTVQMLANPLFLPVTAGIFLFSYIKYISDASDKTSELTTSISSLNSEIDSLRAKEELTGSESRRLKLLEEEIALQKESLKIEEERAFISKWRDSTPSGNSRLGMEGSVTPTATKELGSLIDKYKELNDVVSESVEQDNENQKAKDETINAIREYSYELLDARDAGFELNDSEKELLFASSSLVDEYDRLSDTLENQANSAVTTLNSSIDKINQSQAMNKEEVDALIALYPSLADSIYQTADGWFVEEGAIRNVVPALQTLSDSYVNYQNAMNVAINSGVATRLGLLSSELEGIKSLADAYALLGKATQSTGRTQQELSVKVANEIDPTKKADYQKILELGMMADKLSALQNQMSNISIGKPSGSSGGSGGSGGGSSSAKKEVDLIAEQSKLFKDQLSTLEHKLFLQQQIKGTEAQQVEMMRGIQDALNKQANWYRSQGLSENSEYITSLQKQWWSWEKEITGIFDSIKEAESESLEQRKEAFEKLFDIRAEQIDKEIEILEKRKDAVNDFYDNEIDKLKKANEELDKNLQLQEAQEALDRAKQQKVFVLGESGFEYGQNISAISSAQDNLDTIQREHALQEQIEALENSRDRELEALDEKIAGWEKYKEEWESVVSNYEKEQDRLFIQQQLGIDVEKANWDIRNANLKDSVAEYNSIMNSLNTGFGKTIVSGSSIPDSMDLSNFSGSNVGINTSRNTSPSVKSVGSVGVSQPISIGNISLPNVSDPKSFVSGIKELAKQYSYERT